jgi:hypothetical protein
MKLAQTLLTLALLSTFGCAVAASDAPSDTERADTAAAPFRAPVAQESRVAPAPSADNSRFGGQPCGGKVCRFIEACCNGHCYIPREDVHCLSDGEGASE